MSHKLAAAKCQQGALLNAVELLINPLFRWTHQRVVDQMIKKWGCSNREEAEQIVHWAEEAIAAALVFQTLGPDDELSDDDIPLIS